MPKENIITRRPNASHGSHATTFANRQAGGKKYKIYHNFKNLPYMNNDVSSFMYYMYNKFDYLEAVTIFGEKLGSHIYQKFAKRRGDILQWYGELDKECRDTLVQRACNTFNDKGQTLIHS